MTRCEHHIFAATVGVGRLANEQGEITAFTAEVRIACSDCGRKMQFVGLPAGVDTQGATMSVDGLEARLAICPQGQAVSPVDRIAAHFRPGVVH